MSPALVLLLKDHGLLQSNTPPTVRSAWGRIQGKRRSIRHHFISLSALLVLIGMKLVRTSSEWLSEGLRLSFQLVMLHPWEVAVKGRIAPN